MDQFPNTSRSASSSQRQSSPRRSQQRVFPLQSQRQVSPPPHTVGVASRQQRRVIPSALPAQTIGPPIESNPHPRFCSCRGCAPDLYEESGWPKVEERSGSFFLKFTCVAGCRCTFCRMANDTAKELQRGGCLHDGHKLVARYRCQSSRCPCHVGCSNRQQCRICSRIQ